MKRILLVAMVGIGNLSAQEEEFEVASVIHPVVAELAAPAMIEGFEKGHMAITTSSEKAALHFSQGLTLVNASWGFEAYRHFCEAVKLDPDCLMAYWGICLALADGQHEFFVQRTAAIGRMLDLLEAVEENGDVRWNELEVRFAQAVGFLFTDGVRPAGRAFKAAAEKFPANVQARMLSLFLTRDGFDPSGNPNIGQRKAMEGLRQLLEDHPGNVSVMSMWVNSQTEGPGRSAMLRKEVLPVAEKLVERFPGYPPFRLMLTHAAARCGNAGQALEAAAAARTLYEDYLKQQKVSIYDCEGLIQARLYQVYLNQMKGRPDEAVAEATALASLEVEEARVFSVGAALMMWEGRTAGARLMMSREKKEDFLKAQKFLEAQEEEAWFKEKSYAIYYRDCLGFYLGVRAAIAAGDLEMGKKLFDQFILRVDGFQKTREMAVKTSSYSSWLRAMTTLSVMVPELRGLLAEMETGATKLTAGTWFQSARERQERPANLLPPCVPYPMEWRLGNHYWSRGEFEKSATWYRRGLELSPNHLGLLAGLREAALKMEKGDLAETLKKQIEAIRN